MYNVMIFINAATISHFFWSLRKHDAWTPWTGYFTYIENLILRCTSNTWYHPP